MRKSIEIDTRAGGINSLALQMLRYSLVFVIGWIGVMKFTNYEAVGIKPLIARSPLMSWMLHVWTARAASAIVGSIELIVATLLLLRRWSPKATEIGSLMACAMFITTLSFILSTPGWEPSLGGFPALSLGVGEFIIKDVVLLAVSFWSFIEAKSAAQE